MHIVIAENVIASATDFSIANKLSDKHYINSIDIEIGMPLINCYELYWASQDNLTQALSHKHGKLTKL